MCLLCLSKMSKYLSGWGLHFLMLIFIRTLFASLLSIFRLRAALELENLALRHQIAVLQRTAAKRLKLTSADRLLWICLFRLWHDWRSALAIVKPETVLAWHRAGFRLFSSWKMRRSQPGRPVISRECLDHVVVFHESSLRRILNLYFDYYHCSRTHLSLGKDSSHERFSRQRGGPSWRCRRAADCTTATNGGLPERAIYI